MSMGSRARVIYRSEGLPLQDMLSLGGGWGSDALGKFFRRHRRCRRRPRPSGVGFGGPPTRFNWHGSAIGYSSVSIRLLDLFTPQLEWVCPRLVISQRSVIGFCHSKKLTILGISDNYPQNPLAGNYPYNLLTG